MASAKEEKRIQNESSLFSEEKIKIYPISKKELDDLIIRTAIKAELPNGSKNSFYMGSQANHYDFIYASLMKILMSEKATELGRDNKFNIGKMLPSVYAALNEDLPENYEYEMITEDHEINLENIKGKTGFIEIEPDTYIFVFLASDKLSGGEITVNVLYFNGDRLVLHTPIYGNNVNTLMRCAAGEEISVIIDRELIERVKMAEGVFLKESMIGRNMTFSEYQTMYGLFIKKYQKINNIDQCDKIDIDVVMNKFKNRIEIHR